MRVVTFKLSDNELDELDRIATRLGITRSELIRKAIKSYIRELTKVPVKRHIKVRYVSLV